MVGWKIFRAKIIVYDKYIINYKSWFLNLCIWKNICWLKINFLRKLCTLGD